jgi:hypothetical protein
MQSAMLAELSPGGNTSYLRGSIPRAFFVLSVSDVMIIELTTKYGKSLLFNVLVIAECY